MTIPVEVMPKFATLWVEPEGEAVLAHNDRYLVGSFRSVFRGRKPFDLSSIFVHFDAPFRSGSFEALQEVWKQLQDPTQVFGGMACDFSDVQANIAEIITKAFPDAIVVANIPDEDTQTVALGFEVLVPGGFMMTTGWEVVQYLKSLAVAMELNFPNLEVHYRITPFNYDIVKGLSPMKDHAQKALDIVGTWVRSIIDTRWVAKYKRVYYIPGFGFEVQRREGYFAPDDFLELRNKLRSHESGVNVYPCYTDDREAVAFMAFWCSAPFDTWYVKKTLLYLLAEYVQKSGQLICRRCGKELEPDEPFRFVDNEDLFCEECYGVYASDWAVDYDE